MFVGIAEDAHSKYVVQAIIKANKMICQYSEKMNIIIVDEYFL
jgi:hypothetical protein